MKMMSSTEAVRKLLQAHQAENQQGDYNQFYPTVVVVCESDQLSPTAQAADVGNIQILWVQGG